MSQPDERRVLRGQMLELMALAAAIPRRLHPVLEAAQNQEDHILQEQLRRLELAAAEVHQTMRERVL